ncbi:MAG: 50S ribosomal protein L32 [Thermotogae bacterium]|nr:50S ribosomal protein L32 [Thermotogota bacterium]
MAVPKKKSSRSQTRHRRQKVYRPIRVALTTCPNCGAPKEPHKVCLSCGYYKGRQVLVIE